jgi:hypothetical protein
MTTAQKPSEPAGFNYHAAAVKVARKGARHLAKLVKPDGRFVYRYHPGLQKVYDEYSMLRHCGSVWSMFDVVRLTRPDPRVTDAAVQASRYMRDTFIKPVGDGDRLCLVEGQKAKLGGAGLALLALSEWHQATPDPAIVEIARGIGRYILDQRTADGDLIHGRIYPSGEIYPFRSRFYTGEALFGLLRLFRLTTEAVWRDSAFELLAALGARDYGVAERSHWMLYALDAADEVQPSPENRAYAARIAGALVRDADATRSRGSSTPIACMSEALLAYMRLKRRSPSASLSPSAADCEKVVVQNLGVQLRSLTSDGGFIAGPGRGDVRIDYIQHNISAFAAFAATRQEPDALEQASTSA